jgi:hypothetical protein
VLLTVSASCADQQKDKINVADGDNFDKDGGGKGGDWCIVDSRREGGVGCSRITVR